MLWGNNFYGSGELYLPITIKQTNANEANPGVWLARTYGTAQRRFGLNIGSTGTIGIWSSTSGNENWLISTDYSLTQIMLGSSFHVGSATKTINTTIYGSLSANDFNGFTTGTSASFFSGLSVSGTTLSVTVAGRTRTVTLPSGGSGGGSLTDFSFGKEAGNDGYNSKLSITVGGVTKTVSGVASTALVSDMGAYCAALDAYRGNKLVVDGTSLKLQSDDTVLSTVTLPSGGNPTKLYGSNGTTVLLDGGTVNVSVKANLVPSNDTYAVGISLYPFASGYFKGTVKAGNFDNTSDIRLKTVTSYVDLSVEAIANAPALCFNWKADGKADMGTSAQYWQSVLPTIVHAYEDGYLAMSYDKAALLSVISVAKETVSIKQRIKELEAEIERLKEQIA